MNIYIENNTIVPCNFSTDYSFLFSEEIWGWTLRNSFYSLALVWWHLARFFSSWLFCSSPASKTDYPWKFSSWLPFPCYLLLLAWILLSLHCIKFTLYFSSVFANFSMTFWNFRVSLQWFLIFYTCIHTYIYIYVYIYIYICIYIYIYLVICIPIIAFPYIF